VNTRSRWWVLTIAAVMACAATVSLGFWQLSRAAQKITLQDSMAQRGGGDQINASALESAPDMATLHFQLADLTGEWVAEHTVFLDNRQMHDRVGFYVVTPLRLPSGKSILVYRGWTPRNFLDRLALPPLPLPGGIVRVRGRIAPAPGKLYEPGVPQQTTIRQNLDIALFSAETQLAMLPVVLMQGGDSPDGLQREWPVISTGVEKHYGYAAQWFAIAALIAVLYVWFQLLQPYLRRTKESDPHAQ
jgi:surfeit locus 1 family protein